MKLLYILSEKWLLKTPGYKRCVVFQATDKLTNASSESLLPKQNPSKIYHPKVMTIQIQNIHGNQVALSIPQQITTLFISTPLIILKYVN